MLKEMPKVGDKIRYLGGEEGFYTGMDIGGEYVIARVDVNGDARFNTSGVNTWIITDDDLDKYELVSESSPQSELDLIANLARRVSELEQAVDSNTKDIRTWAQDTEQVNHKTKNNADKIAIINDKIEMLIDDVAFLDERTSERSTKNVSTVNVDAAELSRLLYEALEKGRAIS